MVTWDEVPNGKRNGRIHHYKVEYKYEHDNYTQNKEVDGLIRYLKIENLEKNAYYNITVSAATNRGYGPASEPLSVATEQDSKYLCRLSMRHLRNEKRGEAEMCPAIDSGIVAGEAQVSYWPIMFSLSIETVPEVFAKANLVQLPSRPFIKLQIASCCMMPWLWKSIIGRSSKGQGDINENAKAYAQKALNATSDALLLVKSVFRSARHYPHVFFAKSGKSLDRFYSTKEVGHVMRFRQRSIRYC